MSDHGYAKFLNYYNANFSHFEHIDYESIKIPIQDIPTKTLYSIVIGIYLNKEVFKNMTEKEISYIVELISRFPYYEEKKSKIGKSGFFSIVKNLIFEIQSKDTVLFYEGDKPQFFYMILTGNVSISKMTKNFSAIQESTHIADLGEGKIFGHIALLTDKVRSATITCSSDVCLLKMYFEHYNKAIWPNIFPSPKSAI